MNNIIKETHTKFQMPALLYPTGALAPVISQTTVELHFGKHLQTYIDNLNRHVAETEFEDASLREIIMQAPPGPMLDNAGQVLNHLLYFEQFTPHIEGGNRPAHKLKEFIHFDFGNFDTLKKKMEDATASLFGSGWVWLAQEESGKLNIISCPNGDSPLRHRMTPLYGIDMWEHAYYLDYQNRRAEHVRKLWEIVDWEMIESRLNI